MALALSTAALLGGCGGSPEIVRSTPAPEYPSQWPVVQPNLTQRVPKKHFKGVRLVPGMQTVLSTNFGPRAVTVQKVGMSVVDVDLNHPMAGKDLSFEIEVVEVREASAEELEHGHVHGEGGHEH